MIFKDHLHIRGEYKSPISNSQLRTGSPPHTWRILPVVGVILLIFRITSTYVENTTVASFFDVYYWDHLHIRGEYLTM